jgi:hypothetical protein
VKVEQVKKLSTWRERKLKNVGLESPKNRVFFPHANTSHYNPYHLHQDLVNDTNMIKDHLGTSFQQKIM